MGVSPAHKFGQIIGAVLEKAIEPGLRRIADKHRLFLDVKGKRRARNGRKKITWLDLYGNTHDLDFVLEKNGTQDDNGVPVAFIETAWRRYTKHSRNKAQEIQGAIVPLSLTHQGHAPFIGVILAGEYTEGSLQQLRSLNFHVVHILYKSVLGAFQSVGIDAKFDEDTLDKEVQTKVDAWDSLPDAKQEELISTLADSNRDKIGKFNEALERAIMRQVERVVILPLHGQAHEYATIMQAIGFVDGYDESMATASLTRYEVQIRFNNGDRIEGEFGEKVATLQFLRNYLPSVHPLTALAVKATVKVVDKPAGTALQTTIDKLPRPRATVKRPKKK